MTKSFKQFLTEENEKPTLEPDSYFIYNHAKKKLTKYQHPAWQHEQRRDVTETFDRIRDSNTSSVRPTLWNAKHSLVHLDNQSRLTVDTWTEYHAKGVKEAKEAVLAVVGLEPGSSHYLRVHRHFSGSGYHTKGNYSIKEFLDRPNEHVAEKPE